MTDVRQSVSWDKIVVRPRIFLNMLLCDYFTTDRKLQQLYIPCKKIKEQSVGLEKAFVQSKHGGHCGCTEDVSLKVGPARLGSCVISMSQ